MKSIGIIGYGSMGAMILNGFLASGVLTEKEILVSVNSPSSSNSLGSRHPSIETGTIEELAVACKTLFLCVKPMQTLGIIERIEAVASGIPHIVSVAASVEFYNMENLSTCKITRVIPSITSEIREGVTLMAHNSKVDDDSAKMVEHWFGTLGEVRLIQESDFEVGADLTSCAPGLFSAILHHYIEAGMRYSQFTRSDTEAMVLNTFKATLHLLIEKEWTLSEMISRVATTGGITEEGINVLNRSLPDAFNEMFMATLDKHQVLKANLKNR